MDWQDLFSALAIVCVIEGMMPFVNPAGMRRLLARLCDMSDRELRIGGFLSMLVGLVILYMVRT
jgi:uncharacterized protein